MFARTIRFGLGFMVLGFMPLGFMLLGLASGPALAEELVREKPVRQPTAVMELFTSQSCSSCPAADRVLAAHADRDDVLALAWHVDYWDYLGERNPLASSFHSARQRLYAKRLGEGVYTPQIVVNGTLQAVGNREGEVAETLRSAAREQERDNNGFVPLAVSRTRSPGARGYHVSLLAADPAARARAEGATLFLVWFDPRHEVAIAKGENSGRKVVYRNAGARDADAGFRFGRPAGGQPSARRVRALHLGGVHARGEVLRADPSAQRRRTARTHPRSGRPRPDPGGLRLVRP